jgi:hypothetical protein
VRLVGFLGLRRERERERRWEKKNKKIFFSPASAFAGEEEAAQYCSQRHRVVFHSFLPSFFFGWKKMNLRNNLKMGYDIACDVLFIM